MGPTITTSIQETERDLTSQPTKLSLPRSQLKNERPTPFSIYSAMNLAT